MGFPRHEYWSRLPFPPPVDLPDPGIERLSLVSPALAGGFFTAAATWKRNLFYVFEMFDFPSQAFCSAGQWIPLEPYRDLGEKYAFICECLFNSCHLSEASGLHQEALALPLLCSLSASRVYESTCPRLLSVFNLGILLPESSVLTENHNFNFSSLLLPAVSQAHIGCLKHI